MNKNTIPEQHFMLYKPFGILSQLTSGEEKQILKKRFLSELYDFPSGTMPVGRLDEKSEGLLLMTTNGKLSNYINTLGIEKEYYAQLDGEITQEAIDNIKMGVSIGVFGKIYQTKPCFALKLMHVPQFPQASKKLRIGAHRPTSWISITIKEGKFKQVRKMTAAVGFPTVRLVRVRVGNVHLKDLDVGEVSPVVLNF